MAKVNPIYYIATSDYRDYTWNGGKSYTRRRSYVCLTWTQTCNLMGGQNRRRRRPRCRLRRRRRRQNMALRMRATRSLSLETVCRSLFKMRKMWMRVTNNSLFFARKIKSTSSGRRREESEVHVLRRRFSPLALLQFELCMKHCSFLILRSSRSEGFSCREEKKLLHTNSLAAAGIVLGHQFLYGTTLQTAVSTVYFRTRPDALQKSLFLVRANDGGPPDAITFGLSFELWPREQSENDMVRWAVHTHTRRSVHIFMWNTHVVRMSISPLPQMP